MILSNKKVLYYIILISMIFSRNTFTQQIKAKKLNLKQCIEMALENNPEILATRISVSELKAKIAEARAGFYPLINLNLGAGHFSAKNDLKSGQKAGNYNAELSMHYNIFQGGKTAESVLKANYNYDAGEYGYKSDRHDLILSVVEAYFRLLQSEHFTNVARKFMQRAERHLDFAQARFRNGLASRSDILKAKTEESNAKLDLIHARNTLLIARGTLNFTLGVDISANIKIIDNLNRVEIDKINRDKKNEYQILISEAYAKRPEIKKIESQLEEQKSIIRIAQSDYYPAVSIDANYNFYGTELSQLYKSNYIGLNVSLPIFSGFSRSARISQEKIGMQILKKKSDLLYRQIEKEVWDAFLTLKEVKERIVNTQVFLKDAKENLDISEGEYKEGVGSMLDVLDAETRFVAAEQSYIEALADYKIAQVKLQRTVSGEYFGESLK